MRKSPNLNSTDGVLAQTTYMSRNKLLQSTFEAVAAFYENDEYISVIPGKVIVSMLQEMCTAQQECKNFFGI